eukprot:625708-Pelagomonas_calceolata.AAC.1
MQTLSSLSIRPLLNDQTHMVGSRNSLQLLTPLLCELPEACLHPIAKWMKWTILSIKHVLCK